MMMIKKNLFFSLSIFSFSLIFISCEKVIDIDLNDSEPLYVIESDLNDGDSPHTVRISNSSNFSSNNIFPEVNGAIVTLFDDNGISEVLTEVSSGLYKSSMYKIKGIQGHSYTLKVEIGGEVFIASSKMPNKVNLDKISFIKNNFSGEGAKTPVPIRQDPADEQNNYLFDMYRKDFKNEIGWVRDSAILITDDFYANGVTTQQPLFGKIRVFLPNDSIRIVQKCINREIYKYFFSLSQNGPNGSATPANPISNFSGGCLGYFSAQTKQVVEAIVE